mgnify:CR=1 FL=1
MVLDTSALLAILQDEPERRRFNEAIEAAETRRISAANFVETSIVLEARTGAEAVRNLDLLIAKASITLAPAGIFTFDAGPTSAIFPSRTITTASRIAGPVIV